MAIVLPHLMASIFVTMASVVIRNAAQTQNVAIAMCVIMDSVQMCHNVVQTISALMASSVTHANVLQM